MQNFREGKNFSDCFSLITPTKLNHVWCLWSPMRLTHKEGNPESHRKENVTEEEERIRNRRWKMEKIKLENTCHAD